MVLIIFLFSFLDEINYIWNSRFFFFFTYSILINIIIVGGRGLKDILFSLKEEARLASLPSIGRNLQGHTFEGFSGLEIRAARIWCRPVRCAPCLCEVVVVLLHFFLRILNQTCACACVSVDLKKRRGGGWVRMEKRRKRKVKTDEIFFLFFFTKSISIFQDSQIINFCVYVI